MTQRTATHAGSVSLEAAGQSLVLLPDRAVLWAERQTLFIADPHFGKAQTFRSAGIAAPERSHQADLSTLSKLLNETGATRLVLLGDLLHSKSGVRDCVVKDLERWRADHADLDIVLVRGNHDRSAGDPPASLGIRCVDPGEQLGPFELRHEPRKVDGAAYALAGHLHPGIRLGGSGGLGRKTAARFPAFVFGTRQAVLPAFGRFTGLSMVRPSAGDRIAIVADGEVIDLGSA